MGCDHFGGSGVVSLNVPPIHRMMLNDRYSGIVCFYQALRDHRKELIDYLKQFHPASREEWLNAKEVWVDEEDTVKRAAYWFYMVRLSVIGKGMAFGRSFINPYLPMPGALKEFEPVSRILQDFVLENLDARVSLQDYDAPDVVHYLDPPYLHTDPGVYKHKFTVDDMRELLSVVGKMKGCVIFSHYDNEIINAQDYWDQKYSWSVALTSEVQAFTEENYREGRSPGMGAATECLWIKEAE